MSANERQKMHELKDPDKPSIEMDQEKLGNVCIISDLFNYLKKPHDLHKMCKH